MRNLALASLLVTLLPGCVVYDPPLYPAAPVYPYPSGPTYSAPPSYGTSRDYTYPSPETYYIPPGFYGLPPPPPWWWERRWRRYPELRPDHWDRDHRHHNR